MGKTPKDQNAPKRPLSGYMRFVKKERPSVEKATGLRGIKTCKELGKRWGSLSQDQKAKFNTPARKDMQRWKTKHAAYKMTDEYKEYREFYLLDQVKRWKKEHKRPKDSNAPKRPLSGYMRFHRDNHKKVSEEMGTTRVVDVTKKIAKTWQKMSSSSKEKKKCLEDAMKDKKKYRTKVEKYKKTMKYKAYLKDVAAAEEKKMKNAPFLVRKKLKEKKKKKKEREAKLAKMELEKAKKLKKKERAAAKRKRDAERKAKRKSKAKAKRASKKKKSAKRASKKKRVKRKTTRRKAKKKSVAK